MLRRILAALCLASVSACSTNPPLLGSELSDKIRNNMIVVNKIDKPAMLAERTKAQAIGKFVVATAVSSVAASGNVNSKPGDFQSFQKAANEQMEFGKLLNKQLTESLPDSYKVASGTGTDLAIAKKLSEYYASLTKPDANTQAKELRVAVNTQLWELGYISFLTSQNYALNYHFTVNLIENIDGKDKVISGTSCLGKSDKEMPLETWKADNYQKVNIEAEMIADKCHKQFLALLG